MPERPLLLFPTPQPADRTRRRGTPPRHLHRPDVTRQGQRLSPMFNQLRAAFETRRVEIQQTSAGMDPEQMLVMETIGSIENFAKAVAGIEGLEWMGEFEIDEIEPDQDFFYEENQERKLNGRLYLVMTNLRALEEMLSLWNRYQADPAMKFERGLTKFRDVFLQLRNIRQWDVQDRLLETGVIDAWREDIEDNPDRVIPFEVEFWFRGSAALRSANAQHVTTLVSQEGGHIVSQSIIENIAYHGLLAELPARAILAIMENPSTELVKCENIMFFRPIGQMVAGDKIPEGDVEIAQVEETPLPAGRPVIALFDGLPLSNHHLLSGRLIVDDPDNWEADYTALERVHGSSMASLIVHGDLNLPQPPLSRQIYVRPIMKPLDWPNRPRPEGIPANCLVVDLIHRAVKRLFEGEHEEGPVAPEIKVINLSIGDPARQFMQSMSTLARLLDWLSAKYSVLFVVSAGNHKAPIPLGISEAEFSSLQPDELESALIKALYKDARNRKLLSPAETINGISVGAAHEDQAQVACTGNRIEPFVHPLPSPLSAFGSGYRRAIKPDVIYHGGRQWYQRPLQTTNPVTLEPAIFRTPPGNKSASPGSLAGELNATSHICGTSNATALLSRAAGICYDSLQQIFTEQAPGVNQSNYEVPLLKAMLVHGCSQRDIGSRISEVLRTPQNALQLRGLISRWLGYGLPEIDRVLDCAEHRATLLGFGQLSDGEAHLFRLPLPPALASRAEWRRLTVTLAWLSPILAKSQKYRLASLWFELTGVRLAQALTGSERWAVRRGTVQHEVFEGQSAEPFNNGDVIEIKVNCRKDAGEIHNPVAYGLAVSLEIAEGRDIAVYNEIRTRLAPATLIQPMTDHASG